ncbi:putative 2-deoxy-D-gluconate 3-dehydrogenase [Myxozyma melibiosi]|uniref:2-deoxy-D-gluconate 3-dehydrogenase n=1 Tax=Myxozyma melibiosi TaxID=54550 RepID=A0ABR1FFK9_9ASCO
MSDVGGYLRSLFSLEGRTALVTGATRGIGHDIALAFAKAGAHILLVQRNDNESTKSEIEAVGGTATIIVADLSVREQVKSIVPKAIELGYNVDILLNCAGIQRRHPCAEFPDEDWDEVIQVNLTTAFLLCRAVGKHILDRKGTGNIINIASLNSFQGGLTIPAYASAKGGIAQLTKALSNEWASQGINVNGIAPGYVATDMNEALIANPTRSRQIMERIPAQRWGSPSDFEGAALFLAGKACKYVSGEILVVDGGWMGR